MWPEYIFIYRIYIQIRCCLLWIVFSYVYICNTYKVCMRVCVCAIESERMKGRDRLRGTVVRFTYRSYSSRVFNIYKIWLCKQFFPWLKSIWTLINIFMFFSLSRFIPFQVSDNREICVSNVYWTSSSSWWENIELQLIVTNSSHRKWCKLNTPSIG